MLGGLTGYRFVVSLVEVGVECESLVVPPGSEVLGLGFGDVL